MLILNSYPFPISTNAARSLNLLWAFSVLFISFSQHPMVCLCGSFRAIMWNQLTQVKCDYYVWSILGTAIKKRYMIIAKIQLDLLMPFSQWTLIFSEVGMLVSHLYRKDNKMRIHLQHNWEEIRLRMWNWTKRLVTKYNWTSRHW